MKLRLIKHLYYYEMPTLILCEDKEQRKFIFILMDDEKQVYIGKEVNAAGINDFLERKKDLKTIYKNELSHYYTGIFESEEIFNAEIYSREITEDMLPADGLIYV